MQFVRTDVEAVLETMAGGCRNCGTKDPGRAEWRFCMTGSPPVYNLAVLCPDCDCKVGSGPGWVRLPIGAVGSYDHPTVIEDVHVTPLLAAEWLTLVRSPWPSDPQAVASHARKLQAGIWEHQSLSSPEDNYHPIRFHTDGYIYYGVQRLEAVLIAGVPMGAVVERPAVRHDPPGLVRPALMPSLGEDRRDANAHTTEVCGDHPLAQVVRETLCSREVERAVLPLTYRWMSGRVDELIGMLVGADLTLGEVVRMVSGPSVESRELLSAAMWGWLEGMEVERARMLVER